jgi:hypothetical protein
MVWNATGWKNQESGTLDPHPYSCIATQQRPFLRQSITLGGVFADPF